MPYIVIPGTQTTDAGTNYESTAVETIKEAREVAALFVSNFDTYEERHKGRLRIREMSAGGGKIGPMSNGFVIDVQFVSSLKMAALSGGRVTGQMLLDCLRADDFSPAYDAFNDR